MERYIYINYAYEDQQQVTGLIQRLQTAGIKVCYGNASEERVAGSVCVVHVCTEGSHTSRSYRKILNYSLKHEVDSILLHLEQGRVVSDVDVQMDILHTLFKYKYTQVSADTETEEKKEAFGESRIEEITEDTDELENAAGAEEKEELEIVAGTEEADELKTAVAEVNTVHDEEDLEQPKAQPTKDELYREGRRWMTGDGCQEDMHRAISCFRQAASQGHVEAQYQLSVCYDRGIGVKKSITEAAKWCQMAAYGGHSQAQSEIGYCYEYGQGVVRNIKEAVRWYEIASDQGNIEAKNNLAFCYQKGRGVARNMQKAIQLYKEAAEEGHASAQYNLGFCYWYGEGVKTDKGKAIELFRQSADNGNAKAGQMLKILNQHAYVRQ